MTGEQVRATDEEIGIELKRLREKLFTLRSQAVTEKVEDTSQFRMLRRMWPACSRSGTPGTRRPA